MLYLRGGFPGGSVSKESTCNEGNLGSIPGLGRYPGGGHSSPLQHSCLENPQGQRCLAGYSPRGCRAGNDWGLSTYLRGCARATHPGIKMAPVWPLGMTSCLSTCHPFLAEFASSLHAWSVTKSYPILCDPMDCSPPGSSVHGIFPGKNTGVGCPFLLLLLLLLLLPDPGTELTSLTSPIYKVDKQQGPL